MMPREKKLLTNFILETKKQERLKIGEEFLRWYKSGSSRMFLEALERITGVRPD